MKGLKVPARLEALRTSVDPAHAELKHFLPAVITGPLSQNTEFTVKYSQIVRNIHQDHQHMGWIMGCKITAFIQPLVQLKNLQNVHKITQK